MPVATSRVLVLDVGGEEIEEALRRPRLFEEQGRGAAALSGKICGGIQRYERGAHGLSFTGWCDSAKVRAAPASEDSWAVMSSR